MNWNSIVIVVCVLSGAVAVYKEYIRINKARLALRIIAVLMAVLALACIALPLTYQADRLQQGKHDAVLLTDGFNADSLGRYNANRQFTLNSLIKKQNPKVALLSSIDQLTADSSINQLRILGDGLNEKELQQLGHLPLIFNPEEPRQGITAISWNDKLRTGNHLNIQGKFKNASPQKIRLLLKGLSTNLDSVIVAPKSITPFHLNTIPKNSGKIVYNLLAIAGEDTVETENIPVQIEPVKPLKVLMLTASPDFESRFLKNWLSENGFAIAIRSSISKDKFNKEFINMEQFPLDHLSAEIMNKFDVLLGDLSVLKSLNSTEAAALKQEVMQKGLGVIVRADSTLHTNYWLQRDFPLSRLAGKDTAITSLLIQGTDKKSARLNPGAVFINYQNGTQPLVNDERGHILASSTLAGAGRLIYIPMNNTFSLMLAGNKDNYTALWSLLINKAAGKDSLNESLTVLTAIPSFPDPIKLQLQSTITQPLIIDQSVLSFEQNQLLPFNQSFNYWPQSTGWQSVRQSNGIINWLYVYGNEWKVLHALKKQENTKYYIAKKVIVTNVTKQIREKEIIILSKVYFYVLLLLACAFLWVEAKVPQALSSSFETGALNKLKI